MLTGRLREENAMQEPILTPECRPLGRCALVLLAVCSLSACGRSDGIDKPELPKTSAIAQPESFSGLRANGNSHHTSGQGFVKDAATSGRFAFAAGNTLRDAACA